MYPRDLEKELLSLAKDYPVVTVIGPRQSGKTTLVQAAFSQKPYVNLESLDTRELAESDPRGFLERYPNGAILDEIQRVPTLLSYIQPLVDSRQEKGLFILTGSHQLELHQAISQSLAGRTALLTLLPMSLTELRNAKIDLSLDEMLFFGGFPRIFKDKLDPTKAYRNYIQTYIERDVWQLLHVRDLTQFQRFIRACASRVGQLLNLQSLCNEVGISSKTAKEWISILEASFILFRLQPYFDNLNKRNIKTPKLFFTDVGLACYLLKIEDLTQLSRDPLRGHLVENLVVLELMKARLSKGLEPNLYFFRDAHGHEVDVIFQSGSRLIPIEIKSSKTFHSDFLKNLRFFSKHAGEHFEKGYLIYAGGQEQRIGDYYVTNYLNATKTLIAT